MGKAHASVLIALSLIGCKREVEPEKQAPAAAAAAAAAPRDAAAARGEPAWYRAVVRADDGVEAAFFLGVPAPGAPGQAVFKVGDHEVRADATFDGKALKVAIDVYQTAVEATVGPDGGLSGSFSTSWRAWGASSIPLTAAKVAAPAASALAVAGAEGAALDLKEPRSVWRIAMGEGGAARLVVHQLAPGDFTGLVFFDSGNISYLAGNGRGDALVLVGFDGTAGYRLELALDADRKRARGKWLAGHRFDWREAVTATRGADFKLAIKTKPARPRVKIGLPDARELTALGKVPLVVELAGSWCSTCRNAAAFLAELHREYQPRGLHMVTLLYEFSDDPEFDAKQAEAFKKAYGVTWPVIPIVGGVEDFADIIPSGLTDLDPAGFPITLFLSADRSLTAFHVGFPAANTGDEFRRVAAEYRTHIEALLAGDVTRR